MLCVHHVDNVNESVCIYALIDEQSDACFITDDVLKKLNAACTPVEMRLSTLLGKDMIRRHKSSGLVVKGIKETIEIELPACYSREEIPIKSSQIARPETVGKWPHLRKVADELIPYDESMPVGLLIGINCTRATKPCEIISGAEDEPYAVRTALGWGVIGAVFQSSSDNKRCHFTFKTTFHEVRTTQISNLSTTDFNNPSAMKESSSKELSVDDRKFLEIGKDITKHPQDRPSELLHPITDILILPDNNSMTLKRPDGLQKRMLHDQKFGNDYMMSEQLEGGDCTEKLDDDSVVRNEPTRHRVYHPTKDKHIRPDQINNHVDHWSRFQKEHVASTHDIIDGMYHKGGVQSAHTPNRSYIRFLWWDEGRLYQPPLDLHKTVHHMDRPIHKLVRLVDRGNPV